jgi:DNA-directed RNA polymerase specialized sigma24 family protein
VSVEISGSSYSFLVDQAFHAARKAGATEDTARDCADEAIARLLAQKSPPPNPVAWLRTTAKNLVIDNHRRQPAQGWDDLPGSTPAPGGAPFPRALKEGSLSGPARAAMDWERVGRSLPDLLTPTELLLLMGTVEGASAKDLAEQHGFTPGTVRTTIHNARRKIRAAFPDIDLAY